MSAVRNWLETIGLGQYADAFEANDIDSELLTRIDDQLLKDIGVLSAGHRLRFRDAVAKLAPKSIDAGNATNAVDGASAVNAAAVTEMSATSAERRQLTVMFCDLVGSTALSARLDPEDLRSVIGAYHRCSSAVIERAGGFVAKYMGDGVLAYFGYPRAGEHDAERAVSAGLALVEAVAGLDTFAAAPLQVRVGIATGLVVVGDLIGQGASQEQAVVGETPNLAARLLALVEAVAGLDTFAAAPLQVRVGIATGLVVVGDLIGQGASQEQAVVGETPNLAARLQALAEPGTVVIAPSTRRLTGGLFEYADLGDVELKGLGAPVKAARVVRDSAAESRFEALHGRDLSPLVGRDEELALLQRRWQQAKAGEGRVVVLIGEPGIGKSRLAQAMLQNLAGEPHTRLRHFCSPHHQASALHPFIAQPRARRRLQPRGHAGSAAGQARSAARPVERRRRGDRVHRRADVGSDRRQIPSPGPHAATAQGEDARGAASADGTTGGAAAGADAVRGRALDRPDLARAVDPDRRAGAAATIAAPRHRAAGVHPALARRRPRDDAAAHSPRPPRGRDPRRAVCRRQGVAG